MVNNITDFIINGFNDTTSVLEFLTDKYGAGNEDGVHHYEVTQRSGRTTQNEFLMITHTKLKLIQMKVVQKQLLNRQYEIRLQDKYRQIRLLDTRYLSTFLQEFDRLKRG